MTEMIEPTHTQVKDRIEAIRSKPKRLGLMTQYLMAGRRSEICGKYAIQAEDAKVMKFMDHPVVVFSVEPAKIEEEEADPDLMIIPRLVALPLEDIYEPWTGQIYEYFQERGEGKVFKYSTKTLYRAALQAFEGFQYRIIVGRRFKWKRLSTHGLRHFRINELINDFDFDDIELTAYTGHSVKRARFPAVVERYADLHWRRYFPKLLNPT